MGNLDFSLEIHQLAFLRILFLGVILLLFFRMLEGIARKWVMKSSYRNGLNRLIPPIEGLTWFIFILVSINRLTAESIWSSLAVLLVGIVALIWISWFALKDMIAGIILKTEGAIAVNDRIQINNMTGQITKLGYRILELETDLGEVVNIPFSIVSAEMQIKSNPGERIKSHRFEIVLSDENPQQITERLSTIKRIIFNAPWSSLKKSPQVKFLGEKEGEEMIEVIVYALKVEYFTLIKNYLKTHLPEVKMQ
ncbi:MAG: mechanosensitive ion channel family protein [Bacteroidota bacterium]